MLDPNQILEYVVKGGGILSALAGYEWAWKKSKPIVTKLFEWIRRNFHR